MITLDRAIALLSDSANRGVTTFNQEFKEAEKLGIEALKFKREWRKGRFFKANHLLPGEAEE